MTKCEILLLVAHQILLKKSSSFSTSTVRSCLARLQRFRPASLQQRCFAKQTQNETENDVAEEYMNETRLRLGSDHNVFVVQPDFLGPVRPPEMSNTTPELQLAESVALVQTLPGWKVAGTLIAGTRTPENIKIFSQTRMKLICDTVKELPNVSAIFLSLDRINGLQQKYLVEETGIDDIFDRYTIVLEIFRLRAQTKQAKLQVALASIPYIRANLKSEITSINRQGRCHHSVGGPGETQLELMMRRFRVKEQKIKQSLAALRKNRALHREARARSRLPTVAVVGYTNAGKTTLIKALTGSEKLQPQNFLFATLDVTVHVAMTPGNMKYLLIDTVGFLSNLPHHLIDAFTATMEDMLQADVIVHVCDVSHPDFQNQRKNVYKVLCDLDLPEDLLLNMIEVHNKMDLLTDDQEVIPPPTQSDVIYSKRAIRMKKHLLDLPPSATCRISATEGVGVPELNEVLQKRLKEATGSGCIRLRVPADGDHVEWLEKYASVEQIETEGDYHLIISTTISQPMLEKFKARYFRYTILPPES